MTRRDIDAETTARDPVPAPDLEAQLCFAVYRAGHAFNRLYRSALAELGLTYPQYLVMLALREHDALPMKALCEQLMLDSGTLTPVLKRLEAAGLVRRERSREDERQVGLRLTSAGAALRVRAACVPDGMARAVALSPGETGRLIDDLTRLRRALLAAAGAGG